MTREELAIISAAARGMRWLSMTPAEKKAEVAGIAAVLKHMESPDAVMLNAARTGWRAQNETNWRAIVRSIR